MSNEVKLVTATCHSYVMGCVGLSDGSLIELHEAGRCLQLPLSLFCVSALHCHLAIVSIGYSEAACVSTSPRLSVGNNEIRVLPVGYNNTSSNGLNYVS
jgi:hypothetical protein